MNSLLKFATDAHGGLERWNQLNSLTAELSVTGAIWHVKGKPDFLKNIRIELSLHLEKLITHLVGQNKRFFFTPSRVTLEDESGKLIEARPQDALREIERVYYAPLRAFLYALTYYALGRKKESDAALSELITKYHASNAFEIATIYAFRNQTDEAFEWLDRAYAQRDPSMMSTKVQPLLNSLHNDPRFAALLKKLNLPN